MRERVWVKALVDPKLHTKIPNIPIVLWGHEFETQLDGSLCMLMDVEFVKHEVRAGRIRVLEKPPPGKGNEDMMSKIIVVDSNEFTFDISDYYGYKNLNSLIEKISSMKKEQMIDFANERFTKHDIRRSMANDVIVDKIRSLVDAAYIEYTEQMDLSKGNE